MATAAEALARAHAEDDLERIEMQLLLEAIYQQYGYDFRGYALASLKRRMWRRISVRRARRPWSCWPARGCCRGVGCVWWGGACGRAEASMGRMGPMGRPASVLADEVRS